jgi:hypothetical protein
MLPKKIFFFPGFAEDGLAFEAMKPYFSADYALIIVDYQDILQEVSEKNPHLPSFSAALVTKYAIRQEDILIGHSFGGWAAVNVQKISGSPVVSIGSFTKPHKPKVSIIAFNRLGYWLTKKGMFKWKITHAIARFRYKNTATWGAVAPCIEVMKRYPDIDLLKITKLIAHQPAVEPAHPLLHIHAPKDQTVYPPDVPYIQVHGDHFIQHTHAEEVSKHIWEWVNSL